MKVHHPIFGLFERKPVIASGHHVYDFLGGATDVGFKKGWAKHAARAQAELLPALPVLNEHYFDWIATLDCVRSAQGVFRMVELGAGWAPWLVRAALAARQRPEITSLELLAVEADSTHFAWVQQHFADNGLRSPDFRFLHGAMAASAGTIRFPRITNPDEDYGASTRTATTSPDFVEVTAYTLPDVLAYFSGPVDFIHVDIQGAEYDVLPPAFGLLNQRVRAVMVGTHISLDKHIEMTSLFVRNGWQQVMNFPRNQLSQTPHGEVLFGDGFLYFRNPHFASNSTRA